MDLSPLDQLFVLYKSNLFKTDTTGVHICIELNINSKNVISNLHRISDYSESRLDKLYCVPITILIH